MRTTRAPGGVLSRRTRTATGDLGGATVGVSGGGVGCVMLVGLGGIGAWPLRKNTVANRAATISPDAIPTAVQGLRRTFRVTSGTSEASRPPGVSVVGDSVLGLFSAA